MNKKVKKVGFVAGVMMLMGVSFMAGEAKGESKNEEVVLTRKGLEEIYNSMDNDIHDGCDRIRITQQKRDQKENEVSWWTFIK